MTLLRGAAAIAAIGFAVVSYVYVTLPDVRPLAAKNPTTTAWMEMRAREAAAAGKRPRRVHRWIPYARISPHLKQAVLAAEDDAFFQHEGVDFEQVKNAIQQDLPRGRPLRGASTITQQLAKNLFLSPSRDPLRKLRELMITRRLETALSKARIFEIYLNVIEWGDGIWGADAAARTYFRTSAAALSREQAALLAGSIINPRVYSPARPPARLVRRQQIILSRMGGYVPPRAASSERDVPPDVSPQASPPIEAAEGEQPPTEPSVPDPASDSSSAEPASP